MQKKLAKLRIGTNKTELEDDEDDYESVPELNARDKLHGEALAQAERAAAARPGVNGRLEDVIENIIARGRLQNYLNLRNTSNVG